MNVVDLFLETLDGLPDKLALDFIRSQLDYIHSGEHGALHLALKRGMFQKIKQFSDLRKKAKSLQNQLSDVVVDVSRGGFKIVLNGNQEVKSLTIDGSYLELARKERLEQELVSLFNDAIKKVQRKIAEKMMKDGSYKDLNIPGLSK